MVSRLTLFLVLAFSLALAGAVLAQDSTTPQPPDAGQPADAGPPAPPPPLAPQVAPVELKIPGLGVDADVLPVGMDPDGAMGVPTDPDTAVWWSLGSGTGVPGNVVIAGHVNWGGRLRIFGLLHTLGPGDSIVLVDQQMREFCGSRRGDLQQQRRP